MEPFDFKMTDEQVEALIEISRHEGKEMTEAEARDLGQRFVDLLALVMKRVIEEEWRDLPTA